MLSIGVIKVVIIGFIIFVFITTVDILLNVKVTKRLDKIVRMVILCLFNMSGMIVYLVINQVNNIMSGILCPIIFIIINLLSAQLSLKFVDINKSDKLTFQEKNYCQLISSGMVFVMSVMLAIHYIDSNYLAYGIVALGLTISSYISISDMYKSKPFKAVKESLKNDFSGGWTCNIFIVLIITLIIAVVFGFTYSKIIVMWLNKLALGTFLGIIYILIQFFVIRKTVSKKVEAIIIMNIIAFALLGFWGLFVKKMAWETVNMEIDWNIVSSIGTACGAVFALVIGIFTIKINKRMMKIQEIQTQLYRVPHLYVKNIIIERNIKCELENNIIIGIKGFKYPFYIDNEDSSEDSDKSLIIIDFINTSQAIARFRIDAVTIKNETDVIGNYNISTFGIHSNQIFIAPDSGDCDSDGNLIGFVIDTKSLELLDGAIITLSYYLDSNYAETYKETESYNIVGISDKRVAFYPHDLKENELKKIK